MILKSNVTILLYITTGFIVTILCTIWHLSFYDINGYDPLKMVI
jgi:hypothetical protein